ncbi:Y325-like protein [Mya arenaria]|uniref:Y325-like protein n=1 Tax=Mya arenaria TaxID=6604 RepID=A0ABY7GBD1_MYAAR|nr:Y325-like protein [Mya arenaria]
MIQFQPRLVITGRVKSKLDAVEDSLLTAGLKQDRLLVAVCDVTDDAQLHNLVQRTLETFGKIDVNNAAVVDFLTVMETNMTQFDRIMNTNIRSPFLLTKLYNISKAALDQFTGILANELGEHGVRFLEDQKQKQALGRVGEPDEVAKAITFLASDQASFTSGSPVQILHDGFLSKDISGHYPLPHTCIGASVSLYGHFVVQWSPLQIRHDTSFWLFNLASGSSVSWSWFLF